MLFESLKNSRHYGDHALKIKGDILTGTLKEFNSIKSLTGKVPDRLQPSMHSNQLSQIYKPKNLQDQRVEVVTSFDKCLGFNSQVIMKQQALELANKVQSSLMKSNTKWNELADNEYNAQNKMKKQTKGTKSEGNMNLTEK